MNRAQRRKAAKQSKHAGRVTPKKDKPTAFATITDENGRFIKRVSVEAEELSEEQMAEPRCRFAPVGFFCRGTGNADRSERHPGFDEPSDRGSERWTRRTRHPLCHNGRL
jgi:hypothetical protein